MIELQPMSPAEFQVYLERSIAEYADDKVKAGNWPQEGALERSRQEFNKYLPQGLDTPANFLRSLTDPETGTPTANSPCNNGWVVDNIWYVSWGAYPFYVIPEIYNTAGVNAEQWYRISLYSALYKGSKIYFPGTLTQYQACQQMGSCSGQDNTPSQGWAQLFNSVGADSRTALTNIRWSTDIKWR